jgi:hypothetical protein
MCATIVFLIASIRQYANARAHHYVPVSKAKPRLLDQGCRGHKGWLRRHHPAKVSLILPPTFSTEKHRVAPFRHTVHFWHNWLP